MVVSDMGMLSRIIATVKRWMKTDGGAVAYPTFATSSVMPDRALDLSAGPIPTIVIAATPAAPAALPALALPPTNFLLAARLHSVAKLNPRREHAKTKLRAKRPGRPVQTINPSVKTKRQPGRLWLETRTAKPAAAKASASVFQFPTRQTSSNMKAANFRRAA